MLGDGGMRWLAAYMRDRGDDLSRTPSSLRIDGRSYPLDKAMRKVFINEYSKGERQISERSKFGRVLEHVTNLKYGDPVAAQRRRQEERLEFLSTARFINDEF